MLALFHLLSLQSPWASTVSSITRFVAKRLSGYRGQGLDIESSIKIIQLEFDQVVLPSPHPIDALRKLQKALTHTFAGVLLTLLLVTGVVLHLASSFRFPRVSSDSTDYYETGNHVHVAAREIKPLAEVLLDTNFIIFEPHPRLVNSLCESDMNSTIHAARVESSTPPRFQGKPCSL